MAHGHEDIRKHVRVYIGVFVALMVLTIITVGVAQLHLPVPLAITVALFVAIIKGSLVALFFMHLSNERRAIYATLVLTVVFFAFLMAIPKFTDNDQFGDKVQHKAPAVEHAH